ncbi:NAD-dependent epimerase/dehydratase family protein [Roseisolibacter agri]|uniref:dTDP-glucose 4,6-dehydratase n=1 Tax=Roseisolibacter agri TaxID=2014610 RepID=A0AA37V3G0_9BACT|nr:NAD(P)-dependent oxidoreductase [Roseisolibacter agri]GLC26697.1 dTDP-glucose 4,6-dehydratase [Roseisolibacter agri]
MRHARLPAADLSLVLAHAAPAFEALRGARVFVTGGTGFFGTWLLESFAHANAARGLGAELVVLTRDPAAFRARAPHLADDAAIRLAAGDVRRFDFPDGDFTHVVHGATSTSAALNASDPIELLTTIVGGTHRVLELAHERGARRVLLVSSGAVYGPQPATITHLPETYVGGPDTLDPAQAYAEGKRISELLGAVAGRAPDGPEVVTARCFAFVGPHLPLDAHFAIGNFLRDALARGPIRLSGDGSPYRSYLYAADLAAWLWTLLTHGAAQRAYNVGSACGMPLWDVAQVVARVAGGLPVQRARDPEPGAVASRYVPDVARAESELALRAWTPLDAAVERTLAWHQHNFNPSLG